jgi:TPR repeat protein
MGHAPAMTALATLHLTGVYMKENRSEGLKWLRRAADIGDVAGQCMLGGELLKDGDTAGIELISAAASAGYAPAHTHLGYFYSGGLHGLPRDQKKARHHFETAETLEKECSQWS